MLCQRFKGAFGGLRSPFRWLPEDARQITVVLMLSRREEYVGGDFQAKVRGPGHRAKVTRSIGLELGDALVFPAKRLMHRVSVVKPGGRRHAKSA